MRHRRKVQDLLRVGLSQVVDYILNPEEGDCFAACRVDDRYIAEALPIHQADCLADSVIRCHGKRVWCHEGIDRFIVVDVARDHLHEDVALRHDADRMVVLRYEDAAGTLLLHLPNYFSHARSAFDGEWARQLEGPNLIA